MSSNEKQPPVNPASQQGQQPQYFPPPPPGPPPAQAGQVPKHPNETPIPDYNIPPYNPANAQFAPPPGATDNIYDATPTDEHAPQFPQSSAQHGQHHESDGDASKKKASRFSAFGSAFSSKVAGPVNALANKLGSEGFLPESLDKECEKAARILKAFCKEGIYSDVDPTVAAPPAATNPTNPPAATDPSKQTGHKKSSSRVLLTIPPKVIARAQGLAIFTAVRVGFHAAGSSGSGVLIARLPDGSGRWSPPSGIQITSIGAGFVAGLDIYDCVVVINTREALELFTKTRLSLGSDLAVTAGPFGAGGALDWGMQPGEERKKKEEEDKKKKKKKEEAAPPPLSADNTKFQTQPVPEEDQIEEDAKKGKQSPFREAMRKPVYSYVKSRGLFAGVQIDGTAIAEREGANAKFYGQAVPVAQILKGEVPPQGPPGMWPAAAKGLFDVLRGAEGGLQAQPGQGQPGRPVSPLNPAAFGAVPGPGPATTPHSIPRVPVPGTAAAAAAAGAAPATRGLGTDNITTGVQNLDVNAAGPSTGPPGGPAPPPPSEAAQAKAAEAAAEATHSAPEDAPPPSYSEFHGADHVAGQAPEDLPPAYVEDDRSRFAAGAGDSKTGQH